MVSLYSTQAMEGMKRKSRLGAAAALLLMGAALALCVFFCARVKTGNEYRLFSCTVGVFTVAGWGAIFLLRCVILPAHAEYRHMQGILKGETEEYSGVLSLSGAAFAIPRSITVKKVKLTQDGQELSLHVDASLARRLPPSGSRVRLKTVRKYITAYEVCHEETEKNC